MSNNTWLTSEFQTWKDFGILHPMFIPAMLLLGSLEDALLLKITKWSLASRFHTNRDSRDLALPTEGDPSLLRCTAIALGQHRFLSDPSDQRSGHDQASACSRVRRDTSWGRTW